ncbi:hypothetical protein DCS_07166 [Drechmeria coniospora]|uniref:Uncharacterized protein n=1 Tax=Drechmeria coniospora TaxID=98403 RepID=A0A151GDQ6_DRECN|nr:hypothetical protein DCS_07166 [Drechmeria coniospora]KYK55204.1 hypothetical protein DCS_07166 [Drechmeria coniospora]
MELRSRQLKTTTERHSIGQTLSEQVRMLEQKHRQHREQRQLHDKEMRELESHVATVEKALQAETAKNKRLESNNIALQNQRDEQAKNLEVARSRLKEEVARAQALKTDVINDREMNEDLSQLLRQATYESRKYRTALTAGFKLLTNLNDQVTFRGLLRKTDVFLRLKIAREEGDEGAVREFEAEASMPIGNHLDEINEDALNDADGNMLAGSFLAPPVKARQHRSLWDLDSSSDGAGRKVKRKFPADDNQGANVYLTRAQNAFHDEDVVEDVDDAASCSHCDNPKRMATSRSGTSVTPSPSQGTADSPWQSNESGLSRRRMIRFVKVPVMEEGKRGWLAWTPNRRG